MSDLQRRPNFVAFILTGAVLGIILGAVLGGRDPGGPSYVPGMAAETASARLYLGALFGMLGAGLGAVVALVLERAGSRR